MLILLLLSLFPLALTQDCYPGDIVSRDGSKCFVVMQGDFDYESAMLYCDQYFGLVASIHSKFDNALLAKYVDGLFWLGASTFRNEGQWAWYDASPFDYSNWVAGGPSQHSGDDCLMVDSVTGLWQGRDCSQNASFICQRGPESATPVPPTEGPSTCPEGAICYNGYAYTNSYTMFFSWSEAEKYCEDKYKGHLASIHSAEEEAVVESVFNSSLINLALLGGHLDDEMNIQWSDGTPHDYTNYFNGWRLPGFPHCCLIMYSESTWDNGWEGAVGWQNWLCNMGGEPLAGICKFKL